MVATGNGSPSAPTGNGNPSSPLGSQPQYNMVAQTNLANQTNKQRKQNNKNYKDAKKGAAKTLAESYISNNKKLNSGGKTTASWAKSAKKVATKSKSGMNGGADPNGSGGGSGSSRSGGSGSGDGSGGDGGSSEEKKNRPKTAEELWEEQNGTNNNFNRNWDADDDYLVLGGSNASNGDDDDESMVDREYDTYMWLSTDDDAAAGSSYEDYKSANGQPMQPPTAEEDTTPTNAEVSSFIKANTGKYGLNIFGMPLGFTPIDDPNRRVYRQTFESDLPVVWLNPGTPRYNMALFGQDGGTNEMNKLVNTTKQLAKAAFTMYNVATAPGNRFLNFKGNYKEYYKYVQAMASALYQDMGIGGNFYYSKVAGNGYAKYGVPFYATGNGISISESASNSYAESTIASEANQNASRIRQEKLLASTGGDISKKISTSLSEIISNVGQNVPVLGGVIGSFIEQLKGDQLAYPETWTDSTFDRSYSVQMEFYSPYGDPESIFNYVYLPFISILAMALPLQDGIYGYKQPFLVRASCPGWFECECGVITNLSFTRGDDKQWTADSLPRSIKVSIDIKDLYPSLVQLKNPGLLRYNIGLTSFIETMAGMRYDQLDTQKRSDIKLRTIKNRISEALTFQNLKNARDDGAYNWGATKLPFIH